MNKVIKKSRPNGHYVALLLDGDGEDAQYYVVQTGDEDGTEFEHDLVAAEAYYEQVRKELAETPNWSAQEAYDEAHGTVNGYAPWDVSRQY